MSLIGIAVCGGESSRMGTDKSTLCYYGKPQHDHVYEMLAPLCDEVFISCNEKQYDVISTIYKKLPDLPEFRNTGPFAALLTAFFHYPDHDFLVAGCDYPFVTAADLSHLLDSVKPHAVAAAFYNTSGKYEPLLAWYSQRSAPLLKKYFEAKNHSLQHFLQAVEAEKHVPLSEKVMTSADTPDDFLKAKSEISIRK
jgi:molybdopterin-guanine dinucleotide biosynthesis protein A